MSDPAEALQRALYKLLRDAAIVGVADRIFDSIPPDSEFPYLVLGDDDVTGDDDECAEGSTVTTRIHGWSKKPSMAELKTIAGAVRGLIRSADLQLDGFTIDEVTFVQSLFLKDPDGLTRHSVIEFSFLISHN